MTNRSGKLPDLIIENCRILFRNFSGAEKQFNTPGSRNFCLPLEPDVADQMAKDGWNVKLLKARGEDEEPTPYIQVAVNYKGRPPRIVMVTSKGKTPIGEDMVSVLDWAEFDNIDLIINPYHWSVNGKSGVKAYLKSGFFTLHEDELERKYADIEYIGGPSSAQDNLLEAGRTPLEITDGREDDIMDAELVY